VLCGGCVWGVCVDMRMIRVCGFAIYRPC